MEVTYPQKFTLLSLVLRYRIPQSCFNSFTVCLYSFIQNNVAKKLNFQFTKLAFFCINCENWQFALLTVKPALMSLSRTKSDVDVL